MMLVFLIGHSLTLSLLTHDMTLDKLDGDGAFSAFCMHHEDVCNFRNEYNCRKGLLFHTTQTMPGNKANTSVAILV